MSRHPIPGPSNPMVVSRKYNNHNDNYAKMRLWEEQPTRPEMNTSNTFSGSENGYFCSSIPVLYGPLLTILCLTYSLFGLVYIFAGYRLCRHTLFLTSFTSGSAIVYIICLQENLLPPYGNFVVSVCGGILFGLINTLIQYVGLFINGFHTGLLLAIATLATYDQFLEQRPPTYWLMIMTLLCMGIFFATINLYWKKGLTIFGTSLYGGAIFATTLDYYCEQMLMVKWLWERVKLEPPVTPPCRLSWLILAVWPVATLIGLIVQCALTGHGIHHERSIRTQEREMRAKRQRPLTREERAQLKLRKQCQLYKIRTGHGDVISQTYAQALQKKTQGNGWIGSGSGSGNGHGSGIGGEFSTLRSDTTHLTVLPCDHHLHHHDSDDDLNAIHCMH